MHRIHDFCGCLVDSLSVAGHIQRVQQSSEQPRTESAATSIPKVVLLLGGSGFLGSNLGRALMNSGYQVIVVDRVPPRWDSDRYLGLGEFASVTESELATIAQVFATRRVDIVVHLASSLLPGSSLDALCSDVSDNLLPGLRLLDLMATHGIRRFVYLSSGGTVYGTGNASHTETDPLRPMSYYGWMKLAFEEFIRLKARTTPLEYLILRPSNPYGRYQNLRGVQGLISVIFGRILDQSPLDVWGDGSVVRDYMYIDDFCTAVISLFERPVWNATFNIGSGQGTSISELIRLAREITGRPLQVNFLPSRAVDMPVALLDISRLRACCSDPFLAPNEGMKRYWQELRVRSHP
jgi:UDP-glucose 4-epimerase